MLMCHFVPYFGYNFQLCLTVNDKVYSFLTYEEQGSQEVDAMVAALATAMRNIFPTVPLQ